MRRRLALLFPAVVVLALVTSPVTPARSQAPDRQSFVGEWVLVPELAAGRRLVREAFDRALLNANGLIRALARERLRIDQILIRRLRVELDGSTITTTLETDHRLPRWRTRERYPARVVSEDGSEIELTQHFRNGHLELAFSFPEGRRWMVLERDGEDGLTLTTTIDPMMVDANVRYVLPYRRAR